MRELCLAVLAGVGAHLMVAPRRRPVVATTAKAPRRYVTSLGPSIALGGLAATVGYAAFGGFLAPAAVALFAASTPLSTRRQQRRLRQERIHDVWPGLIEEMRLRTGSLGRSIPQALFEVGQRGTEELRSAFDTAHREWLLTTDFSRTSSILKDLLADATVDITMETLMVAHDLATTDLDRRLAVLAEDRRQDVQGRKDARSRLAGARFARRFVVAVPAGMALAGMSIGNGSAAYQSTTGQLIVVAAVLMTGLCWWWAGYIMRLPPPVRVFAEAAAR